MATNEEILFSVFKTMNQFLEKQQYAGTLTDTRETPPYDIGTDVGASFLTLQQPLVEWPPPSSTYSINHQLLDLHNQIKHLVLLNMLIIYNVRFEHSSLSKKYFFSTIQGNNN